MLQAETVTIEHPDSPGEPMIINKSDFDPAIHKLYEPPAPAPEGDQKPGAGDDPNAPKQEGGSGAKSKAKSEK
jgi:hypothetical protein